MLDRRLFFASALALGLPFSRPDIAKGESVGAPVVPAGTPLWKRVAASPVIVLATPVTDPTPHNGYVDATLRAVTPLRGQAAEGAMIRQVRGYGAEGSLPGASGTAVVLFALPSPVAGPPQLYQMADPLPAAAAAEVRAEIEAQRQALAGWRPDPRLPHFDEVRRLIDIAATEADQEADAFRRLEALGPEGVPAMIALMDDRRALPAPQISLVNHMTDAFEGVRYYGPKVVADAVAAILNQITGEAFGSIESGGTEAERRAAIDGWRIYALHLE